MGITPKESGEYCWLIELFVEVLIMPSFYEMLVARAKPDNEYCFTYTKLWYQASTATQKKPPKKPEGILGTLCFYQSQILTFLKIPFNLIFSVTEMVKGRTWDLYL